MEKESAKRTEKEKSNKTIKVLECRQRRKKT